MPYNNIIGIVTGMALNKPHNLCSTFGADLLKDKVFIY